MENTEYSRNIAPVKLELLVTVVKLSRVQYFSSLIQSYDVNMQFTAQGFGTSNTEILNYLGLTKSTKGVIFSVVREDRLADLMETLEEKFSTVKDGKGVAVAVPMSSVVGTKVFGFLSNDERTLMK